ncbi:MAG TPA: hypothetical protein VNU24_08090 [Solirubrobacteraceae bacterium]|nr:hypothetical protein [Solirubrobacteraceae bacterium]
MSVSTEVQRTLVKSPPELWSELSNPEALARHLSKLGEIRITAVEPETKVEWESESASGVVQLKQSGWGTKVTLSVTRTAPDLEQLSSEPEEIGEPTPIDAEVDTELAALAGPGVESEPVSIEPCPEPEAEPTPESVAAESQPEAEPTPAPVTAESQPEAEPTPEPVALEPERESVDHEPEPQVGFFARLFRKRRAKPAAVVEPEPEALSPAPEPQIELVALAAPEPIYPDPPAQPEGSEPAEDLASELESLEAQMAAETTKLLTNVLDRLGAAHHRPFSRG